MNKKYAFVLLLIVAIIFVYADLAVLGLVTFVVALIMIGYKPAKKKSKKVWEEVDKAKPKDVTPVIKEYFDNASKMSAKTIAKQPKTQYQLTSIHQFQKGTKNFFSELKRLFK